MKSGGVELTPELLAGRQAICGCGATRPSVEALDGKLAFFEFRGDGSTAAETECKHCRFHPVTHPDYQGKDMEWHQVLIARKDLKHHPFEAIGPSVNDLFYCGCRGWD